VVAAPLREQDLAHRDPLSRFTDNQPRWSLRADPFEAILPRRVMAYLIDLLPIGLLTLIASVGLSVLSLLSFGLLGFLWRLLPLVAIAYTTLCIAAPGSATIGMRFTSLTLKRLDGGRPTPLQALLFAILFYVTVAVTSWLILLLPLVTSRHRAAHDFLSGTIMLRSDHAAIY
jgi:uncharacterized RDD family membrane protein YckC